MDKLILGVGNSNNLQWQCTKCGTKGKYLGHRSLVPISALKYCGRCDMTTEFKTVEA